MTRLLWAAVAVYLALAAALALQRPGLQYEEAIFQHGAVHVITSGGPPGFAHFGGSWVQVAGRHWPLMLVPYVGAVGHYVFLPPFLLFGPDVLVARLTTALLGALGIWGVGRLLGDQAGRTVGAAAAFLMAVNASYLAFTVFNKASVAFWMGALGLLCLAGQAYLARRTGWTAFAVGLAAGIGCWTFLMFGWLLAAAAVPAAVAIRRKGVPLVHLALAGAGGLLGLLPFLWSMALSKVEVFRAASGFSHDRPLGHVLRQRLRWLCEILLSDPEMRTTLWGGPPRLAAGLVVLAGALLALSAVTAALPLRGGRLLLWHRASASCLALLAGPLLLADWAIVPHHLVLLVPLAAATMALAGFRIADAAPRARPPLLLAALLYVICALSWDWRMWDGLRRTGGVDQWSDTIYLVHDYLSAVSSDRELAIADWGLHNNLIVLSNNRLATREVFWGATRELSGFGRPWRDEVVPGGRYLLNAGGNRHFLEADEGLRRGLAESRLRARRVLFRQRSGRPYAELYEVEPFATAPLPPALAGQPRLTVVAP